MDSRQAPKWVKNFLSLILILVFNSFYTLLLYGLFFQRGRCKGPPAPPYLVPLLTLVYTVLLTLLLPYNLDVPCYLLYFSCDFANATITTYFTAYLQSVAAHSILHVVL